MNLRAAALPAFAGCLILLLAAEWLLPGSSAPDWALAPAIPATKADTPDADIAAWAQTVLARPVLSATRRPPAIAATNVVNDTLPRLSAIIVIGGVRHAIFAATGAKPVLVTEGGEIGIYRIKTVAPDSVDLLGPDGPLTLRLQFNPPAGAAP